MKRPREETLCEVSMDTLGRAMMHRNTRCLETTNSFGQVWLMTLNPWGKVMVKRFGDDEERMELEKLVGLRHPNVMQIYATTQDSGFVFPPAGSTTLEELVREPEMLRWSQRYEAMRQAAEGLAFLHANGILYKHVEPRTLEITFHGESVHACWMLGLQARPQLDEKSDGYRPLEFSTKKSFTKESDVYAFGVMVTQVVTLHETFIETSRSRFYLMDWVKGVHFDLSQLIYRWGPSQVDVDQAAHLVHGVAKGCCECEASNRPTMEQVRRSFFTWYHQTNSQQRRNDVAPPQAGQPAMQLNPIPNHLGPMQPVHPANRVRSTEPNYFPLGQFIPIANSAHPSQCTHAVLRQNHANTVSSVPRQGIQVANNVPPPQWQYHANNAGSRQCVRASNHASPSQPKYAVPIQKIQVPDGGDAPQQINVAPREGVPVANASAPPRPKNITPTPNLANKTGPPQSSNVVPRQGANEFGLVQPNKAAPSQQLNAVPREGVKVTDKAKQTNVAPREGAPVANASAPPRPKNITPTPNLANKAGPPQSSNVVPRQGANEFGLVQPNKAAPSQQLNAVPREGVKVTTGNLCAPQPNNTMPTHNLAKSTRPLQQKSIANHVALPQNQDAHVKDAAKTSQIGQTNHVSQVRHFERQAPKRLVPPSNLPGKESSASKVVLSSVTGSKSQETPSAKNGHVTSKTIAKAKQTVEDDVSVEDELKLQTQHELLSLCLEVIQDFGITVPYKYIVKLDGLRCVPQEVIVDISKDAINILLTMMDDKKVTPELAWKGCQVLQLFCSISQRESNGLIINAIGQQLARTMSQFKNNLKVQFFACIALNDILYHKLGCSTHGSSQERVLAVASAMRLHIKSVYFQQKALAFIWNTSDRYKDNSYQNVLDTILEVMEGHRDDAFVQATSCGVIGNIALGPDSGCQPRLVKSNVLENICLAIEKHPENKDVANWACFAIQNLLGDLLRKETEKETESQIFKNLSLQICNAMDRFLEEEDVQFHGCGAIGILGISTQYRKQLMLLGCFDDIIKAMTNHKDSVRVQSEACCAIANLSVSATDLDKTQLQTFPVVKTVLGALETHPQDARLVETACCALENLSEHEPDKFKPLMSRTSGLVTKAKENFQQNNDISGHCERTLKNLKIQHK